MHTYIHTNIRTYKYTQSHKHTCIYAYANSKYSYLQFVHLLTSPTKYKKKIVLILNCFMLFIQE